MNGPKWRTALTTHVQGMPHVRGYALTDIIQKLSLSQAIFLLLKGELPTTQEEHMLQAMLVGCIDHGVEAPSTTVARVTASCGVPLPTAVANGVAAIGDYHGGAIEECAKVLQDGISKSKQAHEIVEKFRLKGDKILGFGHAYYDTDPRTEVLLEMAKQTGFHGSHCSIALEIEKELEKAVGRKLCLNVDGVIAAISSDMGFDYRLGKGFFVIGRIAGLVAHVYEEQTREKPVKRLDEDEVTYDGPSPRSLP